MTSLDPDLQQKIANLIGEQLNDAANIFGNDLMKRIRRGEFQNLNPCGPSDDRILKLPDTEAVSGLSSSEIYRKIDNHTFPKPVKLTAGVEAKAVGWRMSDLQAWIATLQQSA